MDDLLEQLQRSQSSPPASQKQHERQHRLLRDEDADERDTEARGIRSGASDEQHVLPAPGPYDAPWALALDRTIQPSGYSNTLVRDPRSFSPERQKLHLVCKVEKEISEGLFGPGSPGRNGLMEISKRLLSDSHIQRRAQSQAGSDRQDGTSLSIPDVGVSWLSDSQGLNPESVVARPGRDARALGRSVLDELVEGQLVQGRENLGSIWSEGEERALDGVRKLLADMPDSQAIRVELANEDVELAVAESARWTSFMLHKKADNCGASSSTEMQNGESKERPQRIAGRAYGGVHF